MCSTENNGEILKTSSPQKGFAINLKVFIILICIIVIGTSAYWSFFTFNTLHKPLQEILASEEVYKGVMADASYGEFLKTNVLKFNLKKVSGDTNLITPFRLLFNYLIRLEDDGIFFDQVEIQYRGRTSYILPGNAAANIAALSYLHTVETIALEFPPMLRTISGKPAFFQPYGDPQYVIQKKLHNFEEFIDNWFLTDMSGDKKITDTLEIPSTPEETEVEQAPEKILIPEIPSDSIFPETQPDSVIIVPESPSPAPYDEYEFDVPPIEPEEI